MAISLFTIVIGGGTWILSNFIPIDPKDPNNERNKKIKKLTEFLGKVLIGVGSAGFIISGLILFRVETLEAKNKSEFFGKSDDFATKSEINEINENINPVNPVNPTIEAVNPTIEAV